MIPFALDERGGSAVARARGRRHPSSRRGAARQRESLYITELAILVHGTGKHTAHCKASCCVGTKNALRRRAKAPEAR